VLGLAEIQPLGGPGDRQGGWHRYDRAVTNLRQLNRVGLDNAVRRFKIPGNSGESSSPDLFFRGKYRIMTSKSPVPPQSVDKKPPCKHPRVQIVSRDEDSEFVECLECREIFESSEFRDMSIEERLPGSDA
jgi:hypothetical protein